MFECFVCLFSGYVPFYCYYEKIENTLEPEIKK